MKLNNKVLLKILITLIGIFVLLKIASSLILKTPEIESTTPEHEQVDIDTNQEIILNFAEQITTKDIEIDSEPEEEWKITQGTQKQLIIKHDKTLYNDINYTIYILHKNKLIHTFDFKTTNLVQSNPRAVQELQESVELNYPLALQTPYTTLFYEVVYSAPLTLEIQTIESSTKTVQEILAEVKGWVLSQGVNPESHQYIIIYPKDIPTSTLKITQ